MFSFFNSVFIQYEMSLRSFAIVSIIEAVAISALLFATVASPVAATMTPMGANITPSNVQATPSAMSAVMPGLAWIILPRSPFLVPGTNLVVVGNAPAGAGPANAGVRPSDATIAIVDQVSQTVAVTVNLTAHNTFMAGQVFDGISYVGASGSGAILVGTGPAFFRINTTDGTIINVNMFATQYGFESMQPVAQGAFIVLVWIQTGYTTRNLVIFDTITQTPQQSTTRLPNTTAAPGVLQIACSTDDASPTQCFYYDPVNQTIVGYNYVTGSRGDTSVALIFGVATLSEISLMSMGPSTVIASSAVITQVCTTNPTKTVLLETGWQISRAQNDVFRLAVVNAAAWVMYIVQGDGVTAHNISAKQTLPSVGQLPSGTGSRVVAASLSGADRLIVSLGTAFSKSTDATTVYTVAFALNANGVQPTPPWTLTVAAACGTASVPIEPVVFPLDASASPRRGSAHCNGTLGTLVLVDNDDGRLLGAVYGTPFDAAAPVVIAANATMPTTRLVGSSGQWSAAFNVLPSAQILAIPVGPPPSPNTMSLVGVVPSLQSSFTVDKTITAAYNVLRYDASSNASTFLTGVNFTNGQPLALNVTLPGYTYLQYPPLLWYLAPTMLESAGSAAASGSSNASASTRVIIVIGTLPNFTLCMSIVLGSNDTTVQAFSPVCYSEGTQVARPIVDTAAGTLTVVASGYTVQKWNLHTGAVVWSNATWGNLMPRAILFDGQSIFASTIAGVSRMDFATGNVLWTTGGTVFARYLYDGGDVVYGVEAIDNSAYTIDKSTGNTTTLSNLNVHNSGFVFRGQLHVVMSNPTSNTLMLARINFVNLSASAFIPTSLSNLTTVSTQLRNPVVSLQQGIAILSMSMSAVVAFDLLEGKVLWTIPPAQMFYFSNDVVATGLLGANDTSFTIVTTNDSAIGQMSAMTRSLFTGAVIDAAVVFTAMNAEMVPSSTSSSLMTLSVQPGSYSVLQGIPVDTLPARPSNLLPANSAPFAPVAPFPIAPPSAPPQSTTTTPMPTGPLPNATAVPGIAPGVIIGASLGAAAAVGLIGAVFVLIWMRRRNNQNAEATYNRLDDDAPRDMRNQSLVEKKSQSA